MHMRGPYSLYVMIESRNLLLIIYLSPITGFRRRRVSSVRRLGWMHHDFRGLGVSSVHDSACPVTVRKASCLLETCGGGLTECFNQENNLPGYPSVKGVPSNIVILRRTLRRGGPTFHSNHSGNIEGLVQ